MAHKFRFQRCSRVDRVTGIGCHPGLEFVIEKSMDWRERPRSNINVVFMLWNVPVRSASGFDEDDTVYTQYDLDDDLLADLLTRLSV
jgi:hypothetical protein